MAAGGIVRLSARQGYTARCHASRSGRATVLLAIFQIGFWLMGSAGVKSETSSANTVRVTREQMRQLSVVTVQLYPFRAHRSVFGQIAFNEDASTPVLTPFSGRVIRLRAKPGDYVKRGDPLFEIDSPEVVQPQNELIAAVTALNKARSQLALAEIVEKRLRGLYEGQAAALKEWQQAQAQLIAAQNDSRSAETAFAAATHRLRIIGRSEAEIAALRENGTITRSIAILAPIDGTVVGRKVGPGQYVRSESSEPLYTISDLSTMWLKAFVPEHEISFARVGQEIEVSVSAVPNRLFTARITMIGASSDPTTRRIMVRSEVPNPDGVLKSEMFAVFNIAASSPEPAPAVPVEAVIRDSSAAAVWVQREPLLFERRKVNIGLEQDDRVQIREGLAAGERVVSRGAIFIDNEWRQ